MPLGILSFCQITFLVFLSINVGNKNHIGVVYIHISTVPI